MYCTSLNNSDSRGRAGRPLIQIVGSIPVFPIPHGIVGPITEAQIVIETVLPIDALYE